ncbi:CD80-like immunoglobulin C2-set [Trinorchestia longiramus]|nr:CD80-like immunoglobulin C2-set [Trinorchestia longiramus]
MPPFFEHPPPFRGRSSVVLGPGKRRQMNSSAWKQQNNWTGPLTRFLSLLFLLTVTGNAEQIRTATAENHFLETELPAHSVFGIEGGEARIPCDITPPSPHDTPILILVSRGATPLYSVDARGGSSSSSTHWVNRDVLGDRVQFLLPSNFPGLSHSSEPGKFSVKYSSKILPFPLHSPVYSTILPDLQTQFPRSKYSYISSFTSDSNPIKAEFIDIHLRRRKSSKVARHADYIEIPTSAPKTEGKIDEEKRDRWPGTFKKDRIHSYIDLITSGNSVFSDYKLQKTKVQSYNSHIESDNAVTSSFTTEPNLNDSLFENQDAILNTSFSSRWRERKHSIAEIPPEQSRFESSNSILESTPTEPDTTGTLPVNLSLIINSHSEENSPTLMYSILPYKKSYHFTVDHGNMTTKSPKLGPRDILQNSPPNMHRSHSHVKLNYWRDIHDDTGFKSRLIGRTIRSNAGRAGQDLSDHPPDTAYGILVIRHLLRTDGGKFHCRVDFRQAPTMLSQAKLTVIAPPSSVDIRGEKGLRVTGVVGPYALGDTMNLWCTAVGGNPPPNISWWLDGELLDDVTEDRREDSTTNNLTLSGLARHHLGTKLACSASNTNLTKPISTSVTIDMKLPPVNVHITGSKDGVREGRLHKLSCTSEGSHPPAVLTWWARTQQLTHLTYQESPDSSSSTSILHLQPSASDDGLHVSCRATNSLLGPAFALEDSVRITVLYSPRVSLKLSPLLNISNINENDDVFLDCDVMANPPVTLLKWHHNKVELPADPSNGIVHSNMSLVLQGVTRKSSGKYTCTAYNRLGSATSDELQLTVRFTPVCRGGSESEEDSGFHQGRPDSIDARGLISSAKDNINSIRGDAGPSNAIDFGTSDAGEGDTSVPKIYGTGVGVPVNITCSVDAHPKPHTFTWSLNATTQEHAAEDSPRRHNSGRVPNKSRTTTASHGSSSNLLTYTPHSSHEFGTLLCWAQNDVGRQADPCVFQVVPASNPASVHNCTVSATSPSSPNTLVLKCLPGWDGGLEQSFTLKVMEGKNFSARSRLNELGRKEEGSSGQMEEWIRGGSVGYIKDQRQTSQASFDDGLGRKDDSRLRGTPSEKGVLAVLAGQSSPHFTVSGLAAGQEYVLQVVASNARGDSAPLIVNYMTPIDVAEGRLSSDTAYTNSGSGGGSGMVILVVVLAILVVFGGIITAAIVMLLRRKREHRVRTRNTGEEENETEDEHRLRSTTLDSVEETQSPELLACQNEMRDQFAKPTGSASFCSPSSPTFEPLASMSSSLIPTISNSSSVAPPRFSRGPTQRERIVRSLPQEPPDPDILLYRLKSSDV